MTRTVAIVCAAGVASTFLARALRERIAEHALDWQVEPLAADQLPARVSNLSVVFVGQHLRDQFVELQQSLADAAVPARLLDSDNHTSAAEQALALLVDLDSRARISPSLDSQKEAPHG